MSPCGLDWQVSQIIAVQLQEIKGVEHRDRASTSTAQHLKVGEPVRPDHYGLAVYGEILGLEEGRARGNGCSRAVQSSALRL